MYIGWGLSPTLQPADASKEDSSCSTATASEISGQQPVKDKIDVMHVDHARPLQRWAGYASFAATLGLLAVGTVVMRTGELPAPKGIELLVF